MSITCETKFHGAVTFEPEQVLQVPAGLFGFPEEKQFLLLELPSARPLVFIQSIRSVGLCFIALPAQVVDPSYQPLLNESDAQALGYQAESGPIMGKDILCLALLVIGEKRTTANLLAPLVIDIPHHRGIQVILNGPYSHQYPLPEPGFK